MEFKVLCVSAPGSEDKLISKCSIKSTKSSDLKFAFDIVDNYSGEICLR
jgi:hypothetical protein